VICITCTLIYILQVKTILDEILEKLPEEFNMMELSARAEEKTPYVLVALQECERMNLLTQEMRRSLKELDLGLKVLANAFMYMYMCIQFPIAIQCCLYHSLCCASLCYRPLLHPNLSPG